MSDDDLHYERLPGGGVKVQGGGVELRVSQEAIERAMREDGLGFNLSLTAREHTNLPPMGVDIGDDSPIENIMHFRAMVNPSKGVSGDADE